MKLVRAFLEHLPAHGADYRSLEPLQSVLEALVARARLAWPSLNLPPERFIAHLAGRLPPSKSPLRTLEAVAAEDLYLACCCAEGNPAALAALETTQLPAVARVVASLDVTGVLADEVKQVLRERLLIKRENGPPRIADYAGQGPLRVDQLAEIASPFGANDVISKVRKQHWRCAHQQQGDHFPAPGGVAGAILAWHGKGMHRQAQRLVEPGWRIEILGFFVHHSVRRSLRYTGYTIFKA